MNIKKINEVDIKLIVSFGLKLSILCIAEPLYKWINKLSLNIVLKKATNELTVNVTAGANFSTNANSLKGGVDGETVNTSINYGIDLGEKGGYINFQ